MHTFCAEHTRVLPPWFAACKSPIQPFLDPMLYGKPCIVSLARRSIACALTAVAPYPLQLQGVCITVIAWKTFVSALLTK